MNGNSAPCRRLAGYLTTLVMLAVFAASVVTGKAQAVADEVRQLRDELTKARQEIQALREENVRLKGGAAAAASGVPAAVGAGPAASSGASRSASGAVTITIPAPVAEGTSVGVEQLLGEYRTSTLAGDARYKGRKFRLEGDVHSFKKNFVGLGWIVEIQGGDRLGLVRCHLSFPGLSDFQPMQGGRVLEGRRPFREWHKILGVGDRLVVEGVGAGVDGAVVVLKDCHPVDSQAAPQ